MKYILFLLLNISIFINSAFAISSQSNNNNYTYNYIVEPAQKLLAESMFVPKSGNWYAKNGVKDNPTFKAYVDYIKNFDTNINIDRNNNKNKNTQEQKALIFKKNMKDAFNGIQFGSEKLIPAILAHNGADIVIDTISFKPDNYNGLHIIRFNGAYTTIEGITLQDLASEARATGAIVHGFNYPGIYRSTGKIRVLDDLVNAGIAVINDLIINEHVHPDDIILDGNSFGSAVALKVHMEFAKKNIFLRYIAGNTFDKSSNAICSYSSIVNIIDNYTYSCSSVVKNLGWDFSIVDNFNPASPYMATMQREGDKLLYNAKLKDALDKKYTADDLYKINHVWFNKSIDLKNNSNIIISSEQMDNLKKINNNFDPHFALYMQTENAFDFINSYIKASNDILLLDRHTRDYNNGVNGLPVFLIQ